MKFRLIFKQGLKEVAVVDGVRSHDDIVEEPTKIGLDIIHVEQFLETLTGMRVHIEALPEPIKPLEEPGFSSATIRNLG